MRWKVYMMMWMYVENENPDVAWLEFEEDQKANSI